MGEYSKFAASALSSLTPSQIEFIRGLRKAELHAHLNGSIPLAVLQELASSESAEVDVDAQILDTLRDGVQLERVDDFFALFPAIYALTSTRQALQKATKAVLESFLRHPDGCSYIELRTTPRQTTHFTRKEYLEIVLDEVEAYTVDQAALIVSVDRRMYEADAQECVDLAVAFKLEGRRVVGVDLCGDPQAGPLSKFAIPFKIAKDAGLGLTLHVSETPENTSADTDELLSFAPDRLGHATFLNENERRLVTSNRTGIELCLSSNLICKTASTIDAHHIRHYLSISHPICICTDDTLPFQTTLLGEYALLLAPSPHGLGLSTDQVRQIARFGWEMRMESK